MTYLIIRILKQIKYDKRLLGLIFMAPILLLTLIYFLLGTSSYIPRVGVSLPQKFESELQKQDLEVSAVEVNDIEGLLKDKTIDAAIYLVDNKVTIRFLENIPQKTGAVTKAVQNAVKAMNPSGDMDIQFIHGEEEDNTFDSIGYIMLGIIAFFFIFILSGVSFIRERSNGTLERFILSPIKRWQIIGGYTIAYGILAIIQSTLILLYAEYILKMNIGNAMPLAMLIMLLLAITAVSVGILISVVSKNEFQVVQFIPILILPQTFFSGLIPLDTMPYGLGKLAYVMPLYYACDALKRIIIYRDGLSEVIPFITVLVGIIIVLSLINTMMLKHYRKI
jgi:ABC-2 type transport system permease protein